MFRVLAVMVVIVAGAAQADVDAKFAKLRDDSEALQGLGSFLDKYVGDCGTDAECKKNTETFRSVANGKKFYMIIPEDQVSNLTMGTYDPHAQAYVLNLTPFFPASNSAVTLGAPARTDAAGNPVLPFLSIKGTIPEGGNAQTIARQVAMKTLRLQIIFTPQGLWTLPKKGGGKIVGVKSRIDAILVTLGRTGEEVALYLQH